MAKDPAINWYFDNWMGGTLGMSRFQKGCYIDLLGAQYQIGPLSLEQIKSILGNDFSAWQAISKKFAQDESGNFFNERLAAEVRKRKEYSESRSKNRQKKDMNNISNSYVEHMNNIPETGIETETKTKKGGEGGKKKFVPPSLLEFKAYWQENGYRTDVAERAWSGYTAHEWKDSRGNPIKNWKQKSQHVWFKNENLITNANGKKVSSGQPGAVLEMP